VQQLQQFALASSGIRQKPGSISLNRSLMVKLDQKGQQIITPSTSNTGQINHQKLIQVMAARSKIQTRQGQDRDIKIKQSPQEFFPTVDSSVILNSTQYYSQQSSNPSYFQPQPNTNKVNATFDRIDLSNQAKNNFQR
jgi:hypothetical protein